VFVLWGTGVKAMPLGEIQMLEIAPRLAGILGIPWAP
jgi:hypothetical protein